MIDCYDILTLSETWLTEKHPSMLYKIEGYALHRLDRSATGTTNKVKKGVGVAMYTSKRLTIDTKALCHFNQSNKDIEIM